jgi:hypothetical protein
MRGVGLLPLGVNVSAALFIVIENGAEFDASVSGKALSKAEPGLRIIAAGLGVRPLMGFYGADDSGVAGELSVTEPERFGAKWFEALDGLESVLALLGYIERNPDSVERPSAVVADLRDFERVLSEAARRKLRWHLEVDY